MSQQFGSPKPKVDAPVEVETAASVKQKYESNADTNAFTDAEKAKLKDLQSSRFLGTFLSVDAIPLDGIIPGNYADVDGGTGEETERYIYDVDDNKFVKAATIPAGETSESIKEKYESNLDTNAFTDAEKAKLESLSDTAESIVNQNNGVIKLWVGTQGEYDAITVKDANTAYMVKA